MTDFSQTLPLHHAPHGEPHVDTHSVHAYLQLDNSGKAGTTFLHRMFSRSYWRTSMRWTARPIARKNCFTVVNLSWRGRRKCIAEAFVLLSLLLLMQNLQNPYGNETLFSCDIVWDKFRSAGLRIGERDARLSRSRKERHEMHWRSKCTCFHWDDLPLEVKPARRARPSNPSVLQNASPSMTSYAGTCLYLFEK